MPTPFYHLWIAQDLLEHPGLAQEARHFLEQNWGAFLFGNTAPDVQRISGQPRQATHYFPYPFPPGQPSPLKVMLATHPELALPAQLPAPQAAFIAGYLCHLLADWLWVKQIYHPNFGPDACWGEMFDCVYIHNVLRAYLDRKIVSYLAEDLGACLEQIDPAGWLPFVEDSDLRQWQHYLAAQLQPQAVVQTVEIFAARQGLPVDAFYRLLDSEERMQQEVFSRLPERQLAHYRTRLLQESAQWVNRYLHQSFKSSSGGSSIGGSIGVRQS